MAFGKGCHLHLIDGSAFIFRAYHALPPLTRKSDGLPIGAVSGFCNMLFKVVEDAKGDDAPTHVAVIFDYSGKTFRNDIYDKYKANRPPAPEDLRPQFPLTRDATRAFNIACIEVEGFEADDIIATLACQARDAGGRATIISSDKDMMQLVGDGVEMLDVMKNRRIDRDGVFEKFGVTPEQVVDVQSLAGDSVDNVPGAPGIGIKTAALLINEFGDLGVDGEILKGCGDEACAEDDIIELSNGCICCTVADDFVPALDLILAREQAQQAEPLEIAFFQNLLTAATLAIAAPWFLDGLQMDKVPLLSGAAALAIVSVLLLSWAYARAEAQILIPVEYTAFAWAAIFGWYFFAEAVTWPTIVGTALIVAGSVVAARAKPNPPAAAEIG
mgnify:CR=1 FL=1